MVPTSPAFAQNYRGLFWFQLHLGTGGSPITSSEPHMVAQATVLQHLTSLRSAICFTTAEVFPCHSGGQSIKIIRMSSATQTQQNHYTALWMEAQLPPKAQPDLRIGFLSLLTHIYKSNTVSFKIHSWHFTCEISHHFLSNLSRKKKVLILSCSESLASL